jgi:hypothetical protein
LSQIILNPAAQKCENQKHKKVQNGEMSNFHDFGLLFVSGRVEKATSILHGTLGVPLPPNQGKRMQLVDEDAC